MPAWYETDPRYAHVAAARQAAPAGGPRAAAGPPSPGPEAPPMPPTAQPIDFETYAQGVLGGKYLEPGNPHMQGMLDRARREQTQTYNDLRSQQAGELLGANRFGGDVGDSMRSRMAGQHELNLGDTMNSMLAGMWEGERNRMNSLGGQLAGFESARAGFASNERIAALQDATNREQIAARSGDIRAQLQAQSEIAQLNAELERDMQQEQLGFNRQQLGVQGMQIYGQQELDQARLLAEILGGMGQMDASMLGLAGSMGAQSGNQQLGALGLVPGLEGAGYTGYNAALGGQMTLEQQMAEAARQRAAGDQAAWNYSRNNASSALNDYASILFGLGGMGGTASSSGFNTQLPSGVAQDPATGALLSGLAGYLQTGGNFGGLFGGGTAQAAPGTFYGPGGFDTLPGDPSGGVAPQGNTASSGTSSPAGPSFGNYTDPTLHAPWRPPGGVGTFFGGPPTNWHAGDAPPVLPPGLPPLQGNA